MLHHIRAHFFTLSFESRIYALGYLRPLLYARILVLFCKTFFFFFGLCSETVSPSLVNAPATAQHNVYENKNISTDVRPEISLYPRNCSTHAFPMSSASFISKAVDATKCSRNNKKCGFTVNQFFIHHLSLKLIYVCPTHYLYYSYYSCSSYNFVFFFYFCNL